MKNGKRTVLEWLKQRQVISSMLLACLLWALPAARADLLLHYTFDETSGPSLDSGLSPGTNGTLMGQATRVANTPDGTGYALNLNFPGATNYVTCGNPDKLNSNISTSLTLVAWINLQANPAQNDRVMDKLATNGGFGFQINNSSATNVQLKFQANTTSGSALANANVNCSNRWVLLAVTYDSTLASGNVRFYSGSTNATVLQLGSAQNYAYGPIANTTNEFRIGSTPASTSDRTPPAFFDDVRVYNAVLSQTDLEAIRAQSAPYSIPAQVVTQPANQTAYAETPSVSFSVGVSGSSPIYERWYFNGTNALSVVTNGILTLSNVTANMAGSYSLFVSNAYNSTGIWSSNATLTVVPLQDTPQLSNIWNLLPGDRPYITGTVSNACERSLAFNPITTNLLLASRAGGPNIVALDPQTGAQKYFMNMSGVNTDLAGTSLGLSQIGVADDGVVYGGSLSVNASDPSTPYYLYRWADDNSTTMPSTVFLGDPTDITGTQGLKLRFGDNLAVRGAGANTQILLAPGSGTNVVVLRSSTTYNFMTEIPPAVIAISGVPSGFAQTGVAFGPGTNTFWAKNANQQLYLVQFDLNANTGAVLYAYSGTAMPGSVRGISTDPSQKWMAGVSLETLGDNARLYDISSLSLGPVLADQELFATRNANTTVNGTASTAFGAGYVFALDSNNGMKAFAINRNYQATPVIALNGSPVMTNDLNTAFADPGAIGTENGSALLVVVSGSVITNLVGTNLLTYTTTDPAGNTATTNRTVYVVDRIPPVVTLNGGASVTNEVFSPYMELGATATDNYDGSLTAVASGPVDVNHLGLYTVTYTARDSSGNVGTTNRSVYVVDRTPPVVTLNGSATVTVALHGTYTELGATAQDNYDGTLPVTTNGVVDVNTVGTNVVTYTATDSSRNVGTASRTVIVSDSATLSPFRILSISANAGAGVVLTWQSQPGHVYQVESCGVLSNGAWAGLSGSITSSASTCSFTNSLSGGTQFYRVRQ